jgi:hypothetical protein
LPLAAALGLTHKIDFDKLKLAVQRRDPILILIDIGGSILYRAGERLPIKRHLKSNEYCQIKMHHHYYRPHFDIFLAQLLDHPRVQLGFYTSIMRKNALPLLFKIMDLPALNPHRAKIFEVFDQIYNVPIIHPSKPSYAKKRDLNQVLDHHKCKEFGFGFHNTVMIDSDVDKVVDFKQNSIVLKEYELEDVLNP